MSASTTQQSGTVFGCWNQDRCGRLNQQLLIIRPDGYVGYVSTKTHQAFDAGKSNHGNQRWFAVEDVPSNSNFRSGSSNGDFSFWVLSWINTHAHRERACIVNALGTSWASRKVAAQDAVVIHTARSGGGSGRDICWASILATRSAHLAFPNHLQGVSKCSQVATEPTKMSWTTRGSKICKSDG